MSFESVADTLHDNTILPIGQALWSEGVSVAKVLIPTCLSIRFMIAGFNTMFGKSSLANEFTSMIVSSIIIYLMVLNPFVQPLLQGSINTFRDAGKEVAPSKVSSDG